MTGMTAEYQETWVPTQTFATRLLLIRRELGTTVKEAAARCGLHYATWSTWENGSKPSDMVRVVNDISNALGVNRDWLMWGTLPTTPDGGGGAALDSDGSQPTQEYPRWLLAVA